SSRLLGLRVDLCSLGLYLAWLVLSCLAYGGSERHEGNPLRTPAFVFFASFRGHLAWLVLACLAYGGRRRAGKPPSDSIFCALCVFSRLPFGRRLVMMRAWHPTPPSLPMWFAARSPGACCRSSSFSMSLPTSIA